MIENIIARSTDQKCLTKKKGDRQQHNRLKNIYSSVNMKHLQKKN